MAIASQPIVYSSTRDILRIQLATGAYDQSEEVLDGVVIDFDPNGRIMAIEIEGASKRANLAELLEDRSLDLNDPEPQLKIFTVREVSQQLQISPRTLQNTIQRMHREGHDIGLNRGSTRTMILAASDVDDIRRWRRSHRPGRPRAVGTEASQE